MAKRPLTDFMPTLYAALDIVSREIVGLIPAVAINAATTAVTLGQPVRVPKTNSAEAEDIVPGAPSSAGDPNLDGVDIVISKSRMVPVKWTGEEQLGVGASGTYNTILRDQFAQGMRALTNEVERDLAQLYTGASRAFGTSGTTPFAAGVGDSAQMRKILLDNGAPMTDLQLVVDTSAGAHLRSNTQLTRANEANSDATLRRGILLDLNGFAIRESGQIRQHTAGSITGSAAVNNVVGYNAGATTIAVDGATDIAMAPGDYVAFGGDNTLKYLLPEGATGPSLNIAAPGLFAAIVDNAAVTVGANYTPNLAFDRNALQLVARAPAMPEGGDEAQDVTTLVDPVSGIPFQIALYRGYRQVRFEVGLAWGVKLIKPEHVAILVG